MIGVLIQSHFYLQQVYCQFSSNLPTFNCISKSHYYYQNNLDLALELINAITLYMERSGNTPLHFFVLK